MGGPRAIVTLGLLIAGCKAAPATQLLVVVESDLAVPDGLDEVAIAAGSDPGTACACGGIRRFALGPGERSLPLSFAVVPREPDSAGPVTVDVCGCRAGAEVVRRTARTEFRSERALLLDVFLSSTCRGVSCGAGTTCDSGTCVDDRIDPATLPDAVAGRELRRDGGPRPDAGRDAGPSDAGPRSDAGPTRWGIPCTADAECGAGFACAREIGGYPTYCSPRCIDPADCTGRDPRSECVIEAGGSRRICSVPCDPISSDGCPAGHACFVVESCGAGGASHTSCRLAGTVAVGDPCATDAECVAGSLCNARRVGGADECLAYCRDAASDCATRETCGAFACPGGEHPTVGGVRYGACL